MYVFVLFVSFTLHLQFVQSDLNYEYLFLKQFGYLTSEVAPSALLLKETEEGILLGDEGGTGPTDEDLDRLFDPNTIKVMQLYAGLQQTGLIDDDVMEMMRTPRCQNPDVVALVGAVRSFYLNDPDTVDNNKDLHKRNSPLRMTRSIGFQWDKKSLTYGFRNVTSKNPRTADIIGQAFATWAECTELNFAQIDLIDEADIDIQFVTGHHPPPATDSFDGEGGVLAHAWYPPIGHAHFDDDEDWSDNCFLYSVALHEIGHALGLDHSPDRLSVMFAYFNPQQSVCGEDNKRPLTADDIRNIRAKYGSQNCSAYEGEEEITEGPGGLEVLTSDERPTTKAPTTNSGSFHSEPNIATSPGPDVHWRIDCGEIVDDVLVSPLYPQFYPNAVDCNWNFSAPGPNDRIQINFYEFNLEESSKCKYDYLAISSEFLKKDVILCGKREGSMIFDTNSINITFKSDNLKQYRGFKMYLNVIEGEVCEALYTEPSGVITSPGYPERYTPGVECRYTVNAGQGRNVLLVFEELDKTSCTDQMMLLDSDSSPISPPPPCTNYSLPIKSSGPNMTLVFSAETKKRARPFKMRYFTINTTAHIDLVSNTTKTYTTPGYYSDQYPNSLDLLISFTLDNFKIDDVLQVRFLYLDVEYDKYCSYDFVDIFTIDNEPERICGNVDVPLGSTTGHSVYLYFHTDSNVARKGFRVTFSARGCDKIVSGSGLIESPNYPSPYNNDATCVYTFGEKDGPVNKKYLVCFGPEFDVKGIPGDYDCGPESDHFVQKFNQGGVWVQYGAPICTDQTPLILSTGNRLSFISNGDGLVGRFQLRYDELDGSCTVEILTQQIIRFPLDAHITRATNCAWIIKAPQNNQIEINIKEIKYKYKRCIDDILTVEDGTCNSLTNFRPCKNERNKRIHIENNVAVLRLKTINGQIKMYAEIKFISPVICVDKHQHCYKFHMKYCTHKGYSSWMRDNCKDYCNECDDQKIPYKGHGRMRKP